MAFCREAPRQDNRTSSVWASRHVALSCCCHAAHALFSWGGGVSIRGLCFLSMYLLEKSMWVSSLRSICHFCSTNKPRTNHTQRSKVFYDAHARRAAQSQELLNRRSCSTREPTRYKPLKHGKTVKPPCSARVPWKAFPPLHRSVCEPFSSLAPSLARCASLSPLLSLLLLALSKPLLPALLRLDGGKTCELLTYALRPQNPFIYYHAWFMADQDLLFLRSRTDRSSASPKHRGPSGVPFAPQRRKPINDAQRAHAEPQAISKHLSRRGNTKGCTTPQLE